MENRFFKLSDFFASIDIFFVYLLILGPSQFNYLLEFFYVLLVLFDGCVQPFDYDIIF